MDDQVQQPAPSDSKTGMWVAIIIVILIVAGGAYYISTQDDDTNTNNTNVVVNTNTVVNENVNEVVNTNVSINTNTETNTNTNTTSNTNTVTNTTVDTADWEQYESSEYNFSINHPPESSITSNPSYNPIITTGVADCSFRYNGGGLGWGISFTILADKTITIDGDQKTKKRFGYDDSSYTYVETILMSNNIASIELFYPNNEENNQCGDILDEMLASFVSN